MISYRNIFIIVSLVFLLIACSENRKGIKPTTKPLMEAVYASGFVVAREEHEVLAQAEGYVAEKLAAAGDRIKKGDPIYIIENQQPSARLRTAQETFELARKNYRDDSPVLAELKAAVENAASKMRFDSLNFVRYSNLLKRNATSQGEFDRIKLAYESARQDYTLQQSRYERTRNQLALDLENARNQLAIAADESGRYVVKSEIDGKVYATYKEKGELIRRNEAVAVVGGADAFHLELDVDELDIHRVVAGQEVLVKIDAYPDQVFQAEITKVYPMVDRRQQSVRADAALKQELPGAFSGLALEANVVIRKKDNAVVIPKDKLLPGDSVLIQTEDGDRKIKVTTGIRTLEEVEILGGLDTGIYLVNY